MEGVGWKKWEKEIGSGKQQNIGSNSECCHLAFFNGADSSKDVNSTVSSGISAPFKISGISRTMELWIFSISAQDGNWFLAS